MKSHCEKCNQTYEVAEGMELRCPWCPSKDEKNLPKVPKMIGKYEILEQIGVGGMGVVYRARHIELNNTVALKVMIAGEHASEETLLRFQREARSAAALHHPNIAPVFDVGQVEPLYYIVMEHVDGKNLDQRAKDTLTPEDAARITRDVARALAYAHERNIVHRDVKPGNILVDREGNAKLVDFGLAKSLIDDKTLTRTGEIIGTASYMPPEQVSGSMRAVDDKSDIYSLGTVLYELLSGRAAYAAETLIMTIRQIEEATPIPPSKLNRTVPRELETICLKAMAREKSRRYETAAEFADDLDRFLKGEPIAARRSSLLYRSRKLIQQQPAISTAAAMSILLISITAALLLRENSEPPPPEPNKQELLQKALPHLETARYEMEKADRYSAEARRERRKVLETAIVELDTAIEIYPEFASAFFYRGTARKGLAKLDLAREDFDRAIQLDPRHGEAYYARIQLSLKSLRQKRLRTSFKSSPDGEILARKRVDIEKDISILGTLPLRPELALAAEAGLASAFDEWPSALKLSEKALEHNRAFADAYVIRASVWKQKAILQQRDSKEMLERAIEDCNKAIRSEVNNTEAYRIRAEIYLVLEQYENSIKDLQEMKSIAPDEAQTYIDRATVLAMDPIPIRSRGQIRADLDRAIALDPTNPNARFLRAIQIVTRPDTDDKFRKARKDLDVALRSDPDFFTALIFRMICHHSLHDEVALKRDEAKMEKLLKPFKSEDEKGIQRRIRAYVKLLSLEFNIARPRSLSRDAEQLLKLKQYKKAEKVYREVLERLDDPKEKISTYERKGLRAVAHYNIACIASLSGKPRRGLLSLRQALKAGYKDWNFLLSDPDLEPVRKLPGFPPLLDRYRD